MIRILNSGDLRSGEEYDHKQRFFVGRPSTLGNPFKIGPDGTREEVIKLYEEYINEALKTDNDVQKAFSLMRRAMKRGDLELVCFCAPLPCHADIIKKILENGGDDGR